MQSLHPKLFVLVAHSVGASVVACALLLYYVCIYVPLDSKQRHDYVWGDQLKQGLSDSLEVRREHLQLTRQLEQLNQTVETTRKSLTPLSAESQFLSEVTAAAEAECVELRDYRRSGQDTGDRHSEVWVVVRGAGSHGAICRFLGRMDDFPHAALLSELEITSTDDPNTYPFEATYTLYHGANPRQASTDYPSSR